MKIFKNDLEKFKKALIQENLEKEVNFISDKEILKSFKKEDSKYLILKLGSINYLDIVMLKKRQDFLDIIFDGIIILY